MPLIAVRCRTPTTYCKISLAVILAIASSNKGNQDQAKRTKTELEGVWTPVSFKSGRESIFDPLVKEIKTIEISENQMILKSEKRTTTIDFKIDDSKDPKWIDLADIDGKPKEFVKAIYAIDKGILKICMANYPNKKRPEKFEVIPGSDDYALMILEKKKKD
jgi:uncharacterized protein (TIGR03067 family)